MKRKIILTFTAILMAQCLGQAAEPQAKFTPTTLYYPNANIATVIAQYQKGNYSGALQQVMSVLKRSPSDDLANYYAGLTFIKIGDNSAAGQYFDKVIALSKNQTLVTYATNANDCLTGEGVCSIGTPDEEFARLARENEAKAKAQPNKDGKPAGASLEQKQLDLLRQKINTKEGNLNEKEMDYMRKINSKSRKIMPERLAMVSDDEVLKAIRTLKEAGVNISVNPTQSYTPDPQVAEMQMLLGGPQNNNNNNNAMMSMLPYMLEQNGERNIDPQVMQAIIMNSVMPDFGFDYSNNNRR